MADLTGVFDAVVTYQFLKLVSQPFNEWKAYELGIIDEEGNTLKKRRSLKTKEEKNSFTSFHVVIRNLKRIIEKTQFGKSKLVTFAAALFLIKENRDNIKEYSVEELSEHINRIVEQNNTKRWFIEYCAKEDILTEDISAATTTGDVAMVDKPMNFAGNRVFKVPTATFMNARLGKKKYTKWQNYVGEAENFEEIRSFALKNPKSAVILQDQQTGAMMYLRYGRK
jgi:hypothetical protein